MKYAGLGIPCGQPISFRADGHWSGYNFSSNSFHRPVTCKASRRNHSRMKFSQLLAASCLLVLASSAPQNRRRNQNVNTKFFTGNSAIDSTAWGAALGAGTQYFANQVFNIFILAFLTCVAKTFPCRCSTRAGAVATEGAPGAATRREQTPGTLDKTFLDLHSTINVIPNQVLPW